ncbi:uncharacterized membrane protein (DUF441 family) [Thermostichus sp. OS-CIW-29]
MQGCLFNILLTSAGGANVSLIGGIPVGPQFTAGLAGFLA